VALSDWKLMGKGRAMLDEPPKQRGLFAELIGDGRPLINLTAVMLGFSGLFALFLSANKHFLPHDVAFLGMTPDSLCSINECRVVHFMFHDRVSFGGSLIAIATLYLWLAAFPLREKQAWAWWLLLVSALIGFGSFLCYLGYGYLDTWHGVATLALLPVFILGMVNVYFNLRPVGSIWSSMCPAVWPSWRSAYGLGRYLMLGTAIGLIAGGATIMTVGATTVLVPQDLAYMGLDVEQLRLINPNLVPLIAHDRAGFGGGVFCTGVTLFFCIWCGMPSRSLWQALAMAWLAGAGTAIVIHPIIGYTDFTHLAPAYLGATVFGVGLAFSYREMCIGTCKESTK
jgi:hypothetical protein